MDNKNRLLQNARSLFARRGVDAVGVQEIVESCAVTKPTLYHYFGSKDGLLQTILDHGFRSLTESLDSVGPYQHDIRQYLEDQATAWIQNVKNQPDFFRIQLSLVFMPTDHAGHRLVRAGQETLQKRIEGLFTQAAEDYGNMRQRHTVLAVGWLGVLNHWTGMVLGSWVDPEGDFFKAGLRQFLYGIFS